MLASNIDKNSSKTKSAEIYFDSATVAKYKNLSDDETVELESAQAEDNYDLKDIEKIFNEDVKQYGEKLKELIDINEVKKKCSEYINKTEKENEGFSNKKNNLRNNLIKYLNK